jgi:hypothetical protein
MNQNIASSLNRADELLRELTSECDRSLAEKHVSTRAVELTHEVCEKLRGILDRVARSYWNQHVASELTADDQRVAKVYFPISPDENAFESTIGRWRWKAVRSKHESVYQYLLSLQPFHNEKRKWLSVLNDLAVQGKHIDFVPQKRFENRVTTVVGPGGGAISWSGVTFTAGISIMGAPINPLTQRIVPTPGHTERIETWVSFVIDGYGVNALGFCQEACQGTRQIATDMSEMFGLL